MSVNEARFAWKIAYRIARSWQVRVNLSPAQCLASRPEKLDRDAWRAVTMRALARAGLHDSIVERVRRYRIVGHAIRQERAWAMVMTAHGQFDPARLP